MTRRTPTGRILCWIGRHDWGYFDGVITFHPTRAYARQLNQYRPDYRCLRCGVTP